MSKWLCTLLLACAAAHAAPETPASTITADSSATVVSTIASASADVSVRFSTSTSASSTTAAPTAAPTTATPIAPAGIEYSAVVQAAAQAATRTGGQALARFMLEKDLLLEQLEQVGHNVVGRTSDLAFTAMGFLGVPYRRGGNSVETGFDCSGFVRAMYERSVGLILPRKASDQARAAETIDRKDLQPGDLVFFNTMRRTFSHVGIYIGDGKFIHSPRSGSEVRVEDMADSYWKRRFDGARRVTIEALTAH